MKEIENFPLKQGRHCSSTALSELCYFYDIKLSEEIIFGISQGLDFIYFDLIDYNNSRAFFPRTPMLEYDFFKKTNLKFKWREMDKFSIEEIYSYIDQGIPVLLVLDTSKLNFFSSNKISISPHTCVVIGRTDTELLISDSINDRVNICNISEIEQSMSIKKAPFFKKFIYSEVPQFNLKEDISTLCCNAIKNNSRNFLDKNNNISGLNGINKMIEDLHNYKSIPNFDEIAKGFFLSIEVTGTGGSAFRKLYLDFLKEIESILPSVKILKKPLQRLIDLYRELAKLFDLYSRKKRHKYIVEAIDKLKEIYELEYIFWNLAYDLF